MKTSQATREAVTAVAMRLAPEDVRPGQDVAVLTETFECASFLWSGDLPGRAPEELVRLQVLSRNPGVPLRVRGVCLPFVLVTQPDGSALSLDVRRVQLARLDPRYAKLVRKSMRRGSTGNCSLDD